MPLFQFQCFLILILPSCLCLRCFIFFLCVFTLSFSCACQYLSDFCFKLIFPWFDLVSIFCFAVCLSLYLSFCLSEDDAYVDKLPTFERHFDSFAGTVKIPSERGKGSGLGEGLEGVFLCQFAICLMFFTQSALDIEG